MKHIAVFAATILTVLSMRGQAPEINWQKSYGGSGHDWGYAIQPTPDGGFIAVGNTTSNDNDVTENFGNQDYWIIKLSPNGSIQWQKSFGGTGHEQPDAVYQTPDGGKFCLMEVMLLERVPFMREKPSLPNLILL